MKHKLTKGDEKRLAAFLAQHRHDGALTLVEAKGFLFAMACCPELILPSEWLSLVMGEETVYASQAEAQDMLENLFALSNQINRQVTEGKPRLPPECRILPDPLKNFEPPAPIHQWSHGFMEAYSWLKETWEAALEGEALELLNMNLFFLGAPAGRHAFEEAVQEKSPADQQALAKDILEMMPEVLQNFATMSQLLRDMTPPYPPEDDGVH